MNSLTLNNKSDKQFRENKSHPFLFSTFKINNSFHSSTQYSTIKNNMKKWFENTQSKKKNTKVDWDRLEIQKRNSFYRIPKK